MYRLEQIYCSVVSRRRRISTREKRMSGTGDANDTVRAIREVTGVGRIGGFFLRFNREREALYDNPFSQKRLSVYEAVLGVERFRFLFHVWMGKIFIFLLCLVVL